MAPLSSISLITALALLLPLASSQNLTTNTFPTISPSIVLPSPTHSDVPPPPLSTSCTINSLTAPDLRLTSFEFRWDYDELLVDITLVNRMAGSTIDCHGVSLQRMITGECLHLNGNVTASGFSYDSMRRILIVNQSWVCDDDPGNVEPITFVASGSVDVPIQCAQINTELAMCVSNDDTRLPLSLSAPLSLTPVLPPPAAGHDNPGCMSRSLESPSWVISDFQWRTGGTQIQQWISVVTVPRLVLEMNITNTATNATVSCISSCGGFIASNLTVPYNPTYMYGSPWSETPSWCPCLKQVKGSAYNNEYYTYTNILLDPIKRVLAIDQTWYCDDQDVKSPVQFTASGQVALPELSCIPRPYDDVSLNSDSPYPTMQSLINGTTCSAANNFTTIGNLSSQNKMDPYALQLPRPTQRSCPTTSVILQHKITPNYIYDLNALEYSAYNTLNNSNSNYEPIGQLNFIFMMRDLDVQLDCRGWDPRLNRQTKNYDPNFWLSCGQYHNVDYGSEGGIQHDDLQTGLVNFDAVGYVLSFNITWACGDVNSDQKPVFRWVTSVQLPELNCYEDDDGGTRTHCLIPGNGTHDYWNSSSDRIVNVN